MVTYCCARLAEKVEFRCDMHPERAGCGDYLIGHSQMFDEYGIWIHDGEGGSASSWITIDFCPFCGSELPPSRRDEWFDRLEALGVEYDDAPAEMLRHGWWRQD